MNKKIAVSLVFFSLWPLAAGAQVLPDSADPARLMPPEQQMQPLLAPPKVENKALPPEVSAPAGSQQVSLQLNNVHLEGSSVYTAADINTFFADDIGQQVTVARLFEMAATLTARYRQDGYLLSHVLLPPQDLTAGDVTFKAIEGYIAESDFIAETDIPDAVRILAASIPQMRPLRGEDLESILLRMRQSGGVDVSATLMPATTVRTDGGVRLLLTVKPQQGQGLLAVNNHGSRYVGPGQVVFSYQQPGLLSSDAVTTVNTIITPQIHELGYLGLRHQRHVGAHNDMLAFEGSVSAVEPGYNLRETDINGYAQRLAVEWVRQLQLQRDGGTSVGLRFDYLNTQTKAAGTQINEDRLRVLRLFWERQQAALNSSHRWQVRFSQGLGALGASDSDAPDPTRADGRPDFSKIDVQWQYNRALAPRWDIHVNSAAQFAFDGLLASEEFAFGGAERGRAYDSAEFTAEHGLATAIELRHTSYHNKTRWQVYGFVDAARLWQFQNVTEMGVVAAAGFGLRAQYQQNLSATASVAWPIFEPRSTPTNGNGKSPRLLLGASYRF